MTIKEQLIDKVFKPINSAGFDVFFVGGCVRDKLMGVEPSDFDITTSASPEDLHKIFTRFSNVSKNSEQFGVTMVLIPTLVQSDDLELSYMEVEIATFRKDTSLGRHPTVSLNASIEEDAARRDFTVNALYEDAEGNVIDPTGKGLGDIKTKTLRFVGKAVDRVKEDPLRLFRACRFQAQKGFSLDKGLSSEDMTNINNLIESTGIEKLFEEVSKERQLKEIKGIFGGKFFMTENDTTMRYLTVFGLLKVMGLQDIFDEMRQTKQNPKWHAEGANALIKWDGLTTNVPGELASKLFEKSVKGEIGDFEIIKFTECGDVLTHAFNVMKEMSKIDHDWIDMMSCLMHDIGKAVSSRRSEKKNPEDAWCKMKDHPITGAPLAEELCKNMKMSNDEVEIIKDLVLRHMDMHHLGGFKSKYSILKLTTNPNWERLVKLAGCDDKGCCKTALDDEEMPIEKIVSLLKIKECIGMKMPERILTGNDLIERGFKPCPTFKKALEVAHKIQIDQDITEKDILFRQVKSIVKGN